MFVPVTTKPYFNNGTFSIIQREFLRFFSLIKSNIYKHFVRCEEMSYGLQHHGAVISYCVPYEIVRPTSFGALSF
jgi:hypothetical protein